ncbi:MAG: hypothetical protein HYT21_03245 [Candidatus Nealsonbacteria bacterium]|nr:hypothetical protein [Candidatus Nealsonbacteria bacterium]
MSAIQEIHGNIKKESSSLGDEMVAREFNRIVLSHILKHFYGFELLIAPYAIAHLKLTLEVERLGFDFVNTKDDADKDNDRFKVYLANTLDDPNKPPAKLFGFDSIPQESESAREVKKNVPILAIVGNPPYSNFGRMNRGEWILNLLKDYKKGLKERKINIDDDFIKFIRFAQWKLEQTGQGIFAMITSNTFIDGFSRFLDQEVPFLPHFRRIARRLILVSHMIQKCHLIRLTVRSIAEKVLVCYSLFRAG